MTRLIHKLEDIYPEFDVAVLDQYGVLHNGITPYDGVALALRQLESTGKPTAILSNSGKRSEVNRQRVNKIGVELAADTIVETSGETAWQEIASESYSSFDTPLRLFPIEACAGDAHKWAANNINVKIIDRVSEATAILLMGMPPGGSGGGVLSMLDEAAQAGLTLICTNPDRTSPDGERYITAPGIIADMYENGGHKVIWYGKPHQAVFNSLKGKFSSFPTNRLLMVGDSLMHDINGGATAGFSTCFIRSGIHKFNFTGKTSDDDIRETIERLCSTANLPMPDYSLDSLR